METRHLESAATILKRTHYVTLATVCEDGSPWNTPVSAEVDENLDFIWGSSTESIHSENILRDGRVFVVLFDSNAPEGLGEGIYMKGTAEALDRSDGVLQIFRFTPNQIWINDEEKNDDGTFKHDIRVEIDIAALKEVIANKI